MVLCHLCGKSISEWAYKIVYSNKNKRIMRQEKICLDCWKKLN